MFKQTLAGLPHPPHPHTADLLRIPGWRCSDIVLTVGPHSGSNALPPKLLAEPFFRAHQFQVEDVVPRLLDADFESHLSKTGDERGNTLESRVQGPS